MADFAIKSEVWLHGRVYRPGQEWMLERDGFTRQQKQEQAKRKAIALKTPEPRLRVRPEPPKEEPKEEPKDEPAEKSDE